MKINDEIQKKELDAIENIIDQLQKFDNTDITLSNEQYSILKTISQGLAASNISLQNTMRENLMNISREIFLSGGLDPCSVYPSTIILNSRVSEVVNIPIGTEFIFNFDNNMNMDIGKVTFTSFFPMTLTPLQVEFTIIENNKIFINLHCEREITSEMINKTMFFLKGSFFHLFINQCLTKYKCYGLIEHIEYSGFNINLFPFENLPFYSHNRSNSNYDLEYLLNFLINEDIGRFFKIKCDKDIPKCNKMQIVIEFFDPDFDYNNVYTIETNYYPVINRFNRDCLPFLIADSNDITLQFLENNYELDSVNNMEVILQNQKISLKDINSMANIEENNSNFWTTKLWIHPTTSKIFSVININNESKIKYLGKNCIAMCTLKNNGDTVNMVGNNGKFTMLNYGNGQKIIFHRVSYIEKSLSKILDNYSEYTHIIRQYIKIYKSEPQLSQCNTGQLTFCTILWNSIKLFSKLIGSKVNNSFYDVNISKEQCYLTEKVILENNHYYPRTTLVIIATIDNKEYCRTMAYFLNMIGKNWYNSCEFQVI